MQGTGTAGIIAEYLSSRVDEFKRLSELRREGWSREEGDVFFQKQQQTADNCGPKLADIFFKMMKSIAWEMNENTNGALRIKYNPEPMILDLCMAPGGFLETVLSINPRGTAHAFTLPVEHGGHQVLLSQHREIVLKYVDITMLAEDMGTDCIPQFHPDAHNFVPRQLHANSLYDLIICDGQVLRTQRRAEYRDNTEALRLTITQLALGLRHLRKNGTMVVLLHKVEAWETIKTLYTFAQFARLSLFKPRRAHTKRSSFYLVATEVDGTHPVAIGAMQTWTDIWKAATFGTEEMRNRVRNMHELDVEMVLNAFGPDLIELGREMWRIQAEALARAPFMQGPSRS